MVTWLGVDVYLTHMIEAKMTENDVLDVSGVSQEYVEPFEPIGVSAAEIRVVSAPDPGMCVL